MMRKGASGTCPRCRDRSVEIRDGNHLEIVLGCRDEVEPWLPQTVTGKTDHRIREG
jgi:hypothetical protein